VLQNSSGRLPSILIMGWSIRISGMTAQRLITLAGMKFKEISQL
jgi:hypothetical protein